MPGSERKRKNPTRGRRTKDTPRARERYWRALRDGNTRGTAASLAGWSRDCLERYRERDPEFAELEEKAEEEAVEWFVCKVKLAAEKNWTAAAWWLERRHPNRFGRVDRTEVSGTGGTPLVIKLRFMGEREASNGRGD